MSYNSTKGDVDKTNNSMMANFYKAAVNALVIYTQINLNYHLEKLHSL